MDADGLALIQRWIKELPVSLGKTPSSAEKLRSEESSHLEHLRAETPSVKKRAAANQLLATTSGSLRLMLALDERLLSVETTTLVLTQVSATSDPQVRDLFERFLPGRSVRQTTGRRGSSRGNPQTCGRSRAGKRALADSTGVQCKNCHRIGTTGREVGPDLDRIGKKYGPCNCWRASSNPSKAIDPKYVTYVVETKDGQVRTGLLVKKDATQVLLKDAQGALVRIPAAAIEGISAQSRSLMPDSLLRDLSAQQVSDLIEYLGSLPVYCLSKNGRQHGVPLAAGFGRQCRCGVAEQRGGHETAHVPEGRGGDVLLANRIPFRQFYARDGTRPSWSSVRGWRDWRLLRTSRSGV